MDLIEQISLNWNSELVDKVFIDFADMDIGVPIKNHKLITASSENIVPLMTSCTNKVSQLAFSHLVCHPGPGTIVDINMFTLLNIVNGVKQQQFAYLHKLCWAANNIYN